MTIPNEIVDAAKQAKAIIRYACKHRDMDICPCEQMAGIEEVKCVDNEPYDFILNEESAPAFCNAIRALGRAEGLQAAVDAAEKSLKEYVCQFTENADSEGGMSLADMLTPPNESTIKVGLEELELLIDSVCGDILHSSQPTDYVVLTKGEAERLRKDAERYRWLCNKFGITTMPCAVERILEVSYVADGKDSIDQAIDQAIKDSVASNLLKESE